MKYTLANKFFRNILFAVIMAFGVALSIIVSALSYYTEKKLIQSEFNEAAENRYSALKREIDINLSVVSSVQALYDTSRKDVDRSDFRNFTEHILKQHPSIQALEWIPRVPDSSRESYERAARRDGFPNFQFTDRTAQGRIERKKKQKEYFPVYFVEPYKGNEIALGFDSNNAERLEAMEVARKTGEIRATARTILIQETKKQFAFLIVAPIYRKGAVTNSDQARWDNLEGFAQCVFRISDVIDNATSYLKPEGVDFFVYDATAPEKERFLYSSRKTLLLTQGHPEMDVKKSKMIEVAGRKWMVIYLATPEFIAARSSWRPWGLLLAGLAFTGVVGGSLFVVSHAEHVEKLAKDLSDINTKLAHEINEHKLLQEALLISEERLRQSVTVADLGIFDHDHLTENIYWSEHQREIFGWSRDESVTLESFIACVYPEDRDMVKAEIQRAFDPAGNGAFSINHRIMHGDGSIRWITAQAQTFFSVEGSVRRPVRTIGAVKDITGQKMVEVHLRKSEKKYRTLIENLPQKIFNKDRNSVYMSCNKNFADDLGIKPDEITGKTDYDFFPEELAEKYRSDDQRLMESGKTEGIEEKYVLDGQEVWIFTVKTPIMDDSGNVNGILGIFWDITNSKKLEQQLRQSQKLEAIGALAGGIAHDFNNLLQGVFGYISLAKLNAADKYKSIAALEQAEKALHMSVNLTTQLLTFSKGGKPIKKKMPLHSVIENSVKFALSGSDTDCRIELDPGLWHVEADEGQIGQVIQNIVLNADQAMPMGGKIVITARNVLAPIKGTHQLPEEDNYVEISVKDNGIGISEEYLSKIFDPYFTTKEKGSGLGLATCYSIINNHGGVIHVSSKTGNGTTFYIYLPATEPEKEAPRPPELSHSVRKGRILLMDDEKMVRNISGEMIKSLDHSVEFAEHGEAAIEKYKAAMESGNPFDIVILDLTIRGGMGGRETIERLLAVNPGIKAIVSSGYSDDTVVSDYHKYGFTARLTKPYKIEELSNVLNNLLG